MALKFSNLIVGARVSVSEFIVDTDVVRRVSCPNDHPVEKEHKYCPECGSPLLREFAPMGTEVLCQWMQRDGRFFDGAEGAMSALRTASKGKLGLFNVGSDVVFGRIVRRMVFDEGLDLGTVEEFQEWFAAAKASIEGIGLTDRKIEIFVAGYTP
jgi:hypothetical protein